MGKMAEGLQFSRHVSSRVWQEDRKSVIWYLTTQIYHYATDQNHPSSCSFIKLIYLDLQIHFMSLKVWPHWLQMFKLLSLIISAIQSVPQTINSALWHQSWPDVDEIHTYWMETKKLDTPPVDFETAWLLDRIICMLWSWCASFQWSSNAMH